MDEIQKCVNMTCEQACCSHEQDRNSGWIIHDYCCSFEDFKLHKQIMAHAEPHVDHDFKPHEDAYNNPPPKEQDQSFFADTNIKHHVHILSSGGWHPINTIISVLATFIVIALVFLTTYYAIKWRRKYIRIKTNQMRVSHTAVNEQVRMENLTRETPLVLIPSSTSQNVGISTKEKQMPRETAANENTTPPSYSDLY